MGTLPNLLVDADWRLLSTTPGTVTDPADLRDATGWRPATVPGTVAGALLDAGERLTSNPDAVDSSDWWFVATVDVDGPRSLLLIFEGLAVLADVWVNGALLVSSSSMFLPGQARVSVEGGDTTVALHFRSVAAQLKARRPRGRWRSSLVREQGLRWIRTTVLGRAPVFSGVHPPIGPWRGIELLDLESTAVVSGETRAVLDGSKALVTVIARLSGRPSSAGQVLARVGEHEVALDVRELDDGLFEGVGVVQVPDVRLWWPHTHGAANLYQVSVEVDGNATDLGSVGVRVLDVDRSGDGFRLSVNGVPIYCRGAVWVPVDPTSFQGDHETTRVLERVREAGLNMIRVPGTMVYESGHFWEECARLGILVWQDAILATLDPPDTDEFRRLVAAETTAFLRATAGNPALVVYCGGSETEQQPTMLGLANQQIATVHELLPALTEELAPHVAYVSSSPSAPPNSTMLATHVGTGVAHYFGVGGYRRPLTDVRSARVRFATESLAFAVPPSNSVIEREFGSLNVVGHHPDWKAAVPRDHGSTWDFEDVRDHYVQAIFGVDPREVRWSDPERYLDLGRAAVCEAFAATLAYWRRSDSGCDGALVLALRDLEAGPGWGVLDWQGTPKAPWYVLRRNSRPISVLVTDDGMDGLRLDAFNETAEPVLGEIRVRAHNRLGVVPIDAFTPVRLDAHGHASWSVDDVVGRFTDLTHVFRFGGQTYDTVTVTLADEGGDVLDEVVHLLGTAARPLERSVGLTATARNLGADGWVIDVATDGAAQYVVLELQGFEPEDSWFHLAPGGRRSIRLTPIAPAKTVVGRVRALNSQASAAVTPQPS
ncbi:beta-mannosidase [Rhodococcus sp. 27YEA15]|uniref:glycosyl hydrolase 2 galactose-binding domain-containing protein n=1 Tax=Rhodococcus sp. 27YEA15 TaxID=3156259 RepID=UPI003C7A0470